MTKTDKKIFAAFLKKSEVKSGGDYCKRGVCSHSSGTAIKFLWFKKEWNTTCRGLHWVKKKKWDKCMEEKATQDY